MSTDKPFFSELELKDPLKNQTKPTEGLKSATLTGETCLKRVILWKQIESCVFLDPGNVNP